MKLKDALQTVLDAARRYHAREADREPWQQPSGLVGLDAAIAALDEYADSLDDEEI